MTTPGFLGGIVLDVLIDEPVMLFLEAVPPALTDFDAMPCQDLFDTLDTESRGVIGQVKHPLAVIERYLVEAKELIDFGNCTLKILLIAGF